LRQPARNTPDPDAIRFLAYNDAKQSFAEGVPERSSGTRWGSKESSHAAAAGTAGEAEEEEVVEFEELGALVADVDD
jgi:hypothetical protein